jgi:hypothetical protein
MRTLQYDVKPARIFKQLKRLFILQGNGKLLKSVIILETDGYNFK